MDNEPITCNYCKSTSKPLGVYHSGFSNQGYVYCSSDSTVLLFGAYDQVYTAIVKDKLPWTLREDYKNNQASIKLIEEKLIKCPCGGSFKFKNPLLCPSCKSPIKNDVSSIYYTVLDKCIDGDESIIWKQP